ncbi:MAG: aminopeptidase [Planctomycetes bacterium]|nr:aminopeptidase [Planctomycetota bacterium]
MNDPRLMALAKVLIDHSCQLKAGENILIEAIDLPEPTLICRLVELAAERGAHPLVTIKNNKVLRALYAHGSQTNLALAGQFERARMEKMDAYIGVRGAANSDEFSDVPIEQMDLYQKHWWHEVHSEVRVPKTKWVVLRYPTDSMAQAAGMSSEAFEEFYFDVCTADYVKMGRDQEPLVARMLATDKVRLVSPGTDLEFSIRDLPVRPCNGQRNIPDGEVFTAPVRDSINGVIHYNTPSRYQGTVFSDIEFEFKQGQIVRATCSGDDATLNKVLDADEGARYIGEWSIGCNNHMRRPMLDTLFDEKIGGSIHLTPGAAYDECDNGNRSRVHWDLVLIQTPEYGGGELYFDGELVRKDGKFLPEELQGLNEGL